MEENNEVTKKEIALTGKFCVVRALKKNPKDAIQEESMKIKGRPVSTDFTRPEWFPYRIGLWLRNRVQIKTRYFVVEIPSDCKIVRDYKGREISQSVAREFLEKVKTK